MWGRRTVTLLWSVFAFVVWNVVFDREVAIEGARFTHESVQRYRDGQPLVTIEAGYRPHVRRAALDASLWAGVVLALGLVAAQRSSSSRGAASAGPATR